MTYALDTNVIIDLLNKEAAIVKQFNIAVTENIPLVIPSAVDYEIIRGFYYAQNPRKEAVYNTMRLNCPVIEVDANIWDCAAQIWSKLRKQGLTIGDFDILIAAFCIVNNYFLITNNTKHFKNIVGLQLKNWYGR